MKMLGGGDEADAAFADDQLVVGGAARLVLPSATYRLAAGRGRIMIDGEEFQGIGAPALITPIQSDIGGGADGVTITLSRLDPNVAATIEAEDYHQKPITIWRLIFDKSGTRLLASIVFMRGRIDTVEIQEEIGGKSALLFNVEGPRRDMSRKGARICSDTDQRTLGGPLDGAMRHISVAGRKTLTWGQSSSTMQGSGNGQPPSKFKILFGAPI